MPIDSESVTEPRLLNGVDLRAFWETLKLRWWVLPASVLAVVAVMWAQESNLQTEPAYYGIVQTYEAQDPTPIMLTLGINPALVKQFPDPANQLIILQSAAELEAVNAEIDGNVVMSISKRPESLTYTFNCTEPSKSKCDLALVSYERRAMELRRLGYTNGLTDLRSALVKLSETSNDSSLPTTINAIDILLGQLQTPLQLISEREEEFGSTITTVERPTFVFGAAAGIVVAILILLQLTFTDSRIRSQRQFAALLDQRRIIGWLTGSSDDVARRRISVALHQALATTSASTIRFVPLRASLRDEAFVQELATAVGTSCVVTKPFAELSVAELTAAATGEIDVVVVQRNVDRRKDLVNAIAAFERSGRHFGGALLVG